VSDSPGRSPSFFGLTAIATTGQTAEKLAGGDVAPVFGSRTVSAVVPMPTPTKHFLPSLNPDGTATVPSSIRQSAVVPTSTELPSGRSSTAAKHTRSRTSAV
jgi:hypothetical protein